jgi:hypothetical protein
VECSLDQSERDRLSTRIPEVHEPFDISPSGMRSRGCANEPFVPHEARSDVRARRPCRGWGSERSERRHALDSTVLNDAGATQGLTLTTASHQPRVKYGDALADVSNQTTFERLRTLSRTLCGHHGPSHPDDTFADEFERLAGPRTLRGAPRRGQAADMPPSTSNTVPEM